MIEKKLRSLVEWLNEEIEFRRNYHEEIKQPLLGWDGGYVEAMEDVVDFLLNHKRDGNIFDLIKDEKNEL